MDDDPDAHVPRLVREELLAAEVAALWRRLDPVPAEVLAAARAVGPGDEDDP